MLPDIVGHWWKYYLATLILWFKFHVFIFSNVCSFYHSPLFKSMVKRLDTLLFIFFPKYIFLERGYSTLLTFPLLLSIHSTPFLVRSQWLITLHLLILYVTKSIFQMPWLLLMLMWLFTPPWILTITYITSLLVSPFTLMFELYFPLKCHSPWMLLYCMYFEANDHVSLKRVIQHTRCCYSWTK